MNIKKETAAIPIHRMGGNSKLHKAKAAKNDEFYTQFDDINEELKHYKEHFKNKVVFCNCDDPEYSNFYQYFKINFAHLGLKKLITTHYENDKPSYKLVITEYTEKDPPRETLLQNGDFRSDECVEFLKESDIVATNPPFSLFREFVSLLEKYNKKYIIIGNKNAIGCKEIFTLIKENRLWLGYRNVNKDMWLILPDNAEKYEKIKIIKNAQGKEEEKKMKHIMACWYTNLDTNKRHEEMILYENYTPEKYPKYDNYDAINVNDVAKIPCDYFGIMGVPITFIDKYNPNQFEILGSTQRGCHSAVPDIRKYDDYWEMKQNGEKTGSTGGKTNENPNLLMNDKKHNYFINSEGRVIQSAYTRIFIRRKK